jgi:hypothetical protein
MDCRTERLPRWASWPAGFRSRPPQLARNECMIAGERSARSCVPPKIHTTRLILISDHCLHIAVTRSPTIGDGPAGLVEERWLQPGLPFPCSTPYSSSRNSRAPAAMETDPPPARRAPAGQHPARDGGGDGRPTPRPARAQAGWQGARFPPSRGLPSPPSGLVRRRGRGAAVGCFDAARIGRAAPDPWGRVAPPSRRLLFGRRVWHCMRE